MIPSDIAQRYRVEDGKNFRLKDINPGDTGGLDKDGAKDLLKDGVKSLSQWQEKLYADDRWSLLLIFQAMDAAGKDGAVEHVMSGVNPQGCMVTSFKQPSAQELDHDFLWRTTKALPERGRIGIFNRSYYEEVLVVRVHPKILDGQKLPKGLVTDRIWQERYESIRDFERHATRNGTAILKFFLHVSKEEQLQRFLDRIEEPGKRWKFSMGDVAERKLWDRYQESYEDAVRATAAPHAPWYVVPADKKWFTRLVVARAIVDTLERLNPQFPTVTGPALDELMKAREALVAEKKSQR
ncbi:MAG TPA: polyphosphate kinase 2 family protein [Xanthobacteraceae bacterium]|nr:polyphosphate kinase 2 family protein [Xanthobacteraceae bacterium]